MTATLFQAAKDGNVELVSSLLEEPSLDIDARDETSNTALLYAVRGNHIDVVSQLLAKGANAVDVSQDDALKQNAELEAMIHGALQHTQSVAFQAAPVIDAHGGKQLPDGTVSYVQPPNYQGHSSADASMHQQHAFHHPMSQPMYHFQPPHNSFFDPTHQPEHRGHASKDSASGSLPPPDVAKMIPCRFFPNCRYGDKCMFAHPVAMPSSASNAGPVSPGAQMFYPSHAYGYPAYGPPQHFYSMAPPMPIQYTHAGVPMSVHMPPPPHMAPGPHSAEQGEAYGHHFGAQHQQHFESSQAQQGETDVVNNEASQEATAETTPAAAVEASKADETAVAADDGAVTTTAPTSASNTTSFSAFMAHHAAPFQPAPAAQNGASMGADGNMTTGSQPFSRGTKGPRRGGASMGGSFGSRAEFGKRSSERSACHFFARSACKHGEDCRFPHILPDGTDMRGPNAGRSGHSIEAARAINRALAAKNARGSANGSSVNGANAAHSQPSVSNGDSLPSASTNVTVSTSPASAQTTISAADKKEATEAASQDDAAEKLASQVNTPASNGAAAAKKEQSNNAKPNGTPAAASSSAAPKATASTSASSGKSEAKSDNSANGKRAAAAGKPEDGKAASGLPSNVNGDRIPASIPSKPMVNGNVNGSAPASRQNGAKPQANAVQGGKGHQGQQNGARVRTNQNGNGRTNGQTGQNGGAQKKFVPQQRLPSADDFPALSNGVGSSTSVSAPAPQASSANGVAKANFSAILSAPAPPKKQPEPVKESEAAAADDKAAPASSSDEAKPAEAEAKSSTTAAQSSSSTTNGTAAPMMDFAAVVQSNPVAV